MRFYVFSTVFDVFPGDVHTTPSSFPLIAATAVPLLLILIFLFLLLLLLLLFLLFHDTFTPAMKFSFA